MSSTGYYKHKSIIESKNCILLTTEDEYKTIKKTNIKYRIISSCGHEINIFMNVFIQRETGVICSKCKKQKVTQKKIENNDYSLINGNNPSILIEYEGFLYFKNLLQEKYEFKKTIEGCLADFCIKKKCSTEDLWIPIQLKTSKNEKYEFHVEGKYVDMLIFFINMKYEKKKIWIMNGNMLIDQKKISIGVNKSKYSKYEVNETNIFDYIESISEEVVHKDFESFNTGSTLYLKREKKYAYKREKLLDFIKFEYSEIGYNCTDFMIGTIKNQEKTSESYKNTGIRYCLCKRGKSYKKETYIPYDKNDNDYYWLHLCNTNKVYVIPQKDLIDFEFITDTKKGKKQIVLFPNATVKNRSKNVYFNKFLYNLDDKNDIEKIKSIFKTE